MIWHDWLPVFYFIFLAEIIECSGAKVNHSICTNSSWYSFTSCATNMSVTLLFVTSSTYLRCPRREQTSRRSSSRATRIRRRVRQQRLPGYLSSPQSSSWLVYCNRKSELRNTFSRSSVDLWQCRATGGVSVYSKNYGTECLEKTVFINDLMAI